MADSQPPSDTDVYNAWYNKTNDPGTITTAYYVSLHSIEQSQNVEKHPFNVDRQHFNYRQQPRYYPDTDHGQQKSSIEQRQSFIGEYTTIQQPLNTSSKDTVSGCPDLLIRAFLVCQCCLWPTGIAAIIYAQKVVNAYKEGKIADGNRYNRITRQLIFVSAVIGSLLAAIYVVIVERVIFQYDGNWCRRVMRQLIIASMLVLIYQLIISISSYST